MSDKPNIILINMDDMGWKDLSCCGSTFYETPNIDKLCSEGMMFSNSYASCPVCSPSRVSMMTGKYPARLQTTDWFDHGGQYHPLKGSLIDAPYINHLPVGEITIAQSLKEGGYDTWHIGKWHLGGQEYYPEKFGFDVNIGGCSWGHPGYGYFSPYHIETLAEGPDGEYLTDRLTNEAINLIKSSSDKPFFMNLCHYAVHAPIQAKKVDIERFKQKAKRMKLDKIESFVNGDKFKTTNKKGYVKHRVVQSDPVYAAMIWNLDENVGKLMQALYDCGKADNTMIVFTSDNGGFSTTDNSPTCNFPASEGKGWLYEGGLRVPLIVWYPGKVPASTVCDTPVITTDMYPTFLETAGLPLRCEQHCDGMSLWPLLKRGSLPPRPIFWHYPHYGDQGGTPGSCVIFGSYKLIEFFDDMHTELYDLENDISETFDISQNFPEKTKELTHILHEWQKEVSALFPSPNPDFEGKDKASVT